VRQLIGVLATPLVLALLLVAVAAIARLCGGRAAARWLLGAAAALACLASLPAVGDALLRPLERQNPPLRTEAQSSVAWVVVLGSGYSPRDSVPVTAAIDPDGLSRIVEGMRLVHLLGARHLIVSGGARKGHAAPALGYATLVRQLGFNEPDLIVLGTAVNTAAESRAIAARVGAQPFFLVTSAYHMPRALKQMQRAGAHAIAAPTGQLVDDTMAEKPGDWVPSSSGLHKTERALHEYLGLAALAAGLD
jgi:uncharacterized SAM-binding protein YcdF (DUF218 family)